MRSRRPARVPRARLVAVLLLGMAPRVAVAQPDGEADKPPSSTPAPPPNALPVAPANPSAADVAKAKAVFAAGGRAYEQGDYLAAIQAFEQAYTLSGRSTILFSLAQAHRKTFVDSQLPLHREAAIQLYRSYLEQVKVGGRRADAIAGLEVLTGGSVTMLPSGSPAAAVLTRKTQLAIDSSTPGALISIDGGPAAPPQVMAEVKPGRHTVKVSAPGYISREFTTQAVDGQITPETYELDEQSAKLQIGRPSGATVFVDGRDMGETDQLTLPSGDHFVSVALSGHASKAETVSLAPGESADVRFDLETTPQRDASIGFLIGGGVAVIAGATLVGVAIAKQVEAQEIDDRRLAGSISVEQLRTYEDLSEERDLYRGGGVLIGGAGVAAAMIGAALFLFDDRPPITPPIEGLDAKKKGDDPAEEDPSELDPMSFLPLLKFRAGGGRRDDRRGFEVGGVWSTEF